VKRSELIRLVRLAAQDAQIIRTDEEAIVQAVSDPSVTHIGWGAWFVYKDKDTPCGCPAALGYGLKPTQPETRLPIQAHRFAESFDTIAKTSEDVPGMGRIIEIEDA
jgi:hypothetical protein